MPSPVRLWYFINPTQSIIWAFSFASSQLDSVTTETWLILSSCSLGLLILAMALFLRRWPGSDLLWPWGSPWHNEGIGWKLYGGNNRLMEKSWWEKPWGQPAPTARLSGVFRALLKRRLCGTLFLAGLVGRPVVIIKDPDQSNLMGKTQLEFTMSE